jgi:branched-chain amino acid transport system permease protein
MGSGEVTNAAPSRPRVRFKPATAILALAVVALLLFPRFVESPYAFHIMILLFLSTIMGTGWNILGGYTGQYSVGHAAYFGTGAYTTMILMRSCHVAPWFGVWAGVAAVTLIALVIGSICFRLRGPYFVLASIAVAEIMRLSAMNLKKITNGAEGILATDLPPFTIGNTLITDFVSKVPFYYIGLVLAIVTIAVAAAILGSKLGYCFQAIREDQDAADSLGISLSFYKNIALVVSAIFTGIAGSFYAIYIGFVDPSTVMSLDISVQIVLVSIIGGIGTIYGPLVGSVVIIPVAEGLRSNFIADTLFKTGLVVQDSRAGAFLKENLAHAHALIYGVLVVIVILFMPEGIIGFVKKYWRRRIPEIG